MNIKRMLASLGVASVLAAAFSLGASPAMADTSCNQTISVAPNPKDSVTFKGELFQNEVTTPGSSKSCRLIIKNAAGESANIVVSLTNIKASADTAWNEDFKVIWRAQRGVQAQSSMAELSKYSSKNISTFELAKDSSGSFDIGYAVALESVSGNGNYPKTSFDVTITAYGDGVPVPPDPVDPPPVAPPGTTPTNPSVPDNTGNTPDTGTKPGDNGDNSSNDEETNGSDIENSTDTETIDEGPSIGDLSGAEDKPEVTPTEPSDPDSPIADQDEGINFVLLSGIVAGLFILAAIVWLLLLLRRRREEE